MSETPLRSRLDWGHLCLVLLFAGVTIAYLADAWMASGSLRNLVLLVPVSAISLVLCGIVVVNIVRRAVRPAEAGQDGSEEAAAEPSAPSAPKAGSLIERYKAFMLMALFALYIVTLPWLGFDVGSAVFVAAALLLDGERRLWLIALVSICFALATTTLFHWLLPYPMPTLVM